MKFKSVQWRYLAQLEQFPCFVLERGQPWNDYGHVTRFTAYFYPDAETEWTLGVVKILQRGQDRTEPPPEFVRLDDRFCSLGQSLEFYERIQGLIGSPASEEILGALRDVVFEPGIRSAFENERGYIRSLLRASSALRALREAGALFGKPFEPPPPLSFSYRRKLAGFDAPHELSIAFEIREEWLGRAVALVGRNGTGKTALLSRLAYALSGLDEDDAAELSPQRLPISQVVAISYSAFDTFTRPRHEVGVNYVYCGLRDERDTVNLHWAMSGFATSLAELQEVNRSVQYFQLLKDSGVVDEFPQPAQLLENSASLSDWFHQQSSGHKLVLLVVANVLSRIATKSILLFDEPETHLHPHLLSSLMRLLHMLLHEYDSYAIVATHSPIVLQELPAQDIRILEREGNIPLITGYPGQSFGENLTEIVNTAFRVNEKSKNYFRILQQLVSTKSRSELDAIFREGLGLNARMALHALTVDREAEEDD